MDIIVPVFPVKILVLGSVIVWNYLQCQDESLVFTFLVLFLTALVTDILRFRVLIDELGEHATFRP